MKITRILDLCLLLPFRLVLILCCMCFWIPVLFVLSVGKGESGFEVFIKMCVESARWIWRPSLEQDFWSEDADF